MSKGLTVTKGDMLIIAAVLLAALLLAAGLFFGRPRDAATGLCAEIYVDGQLQQTVLLAEGERTVHLENAGGYNLLRITPEGICMVEADCHNQDCVLAGPQSRPGAVIACLPHRVLVLLAGLPDWEVDAVAY